MTQPDAQTPAPDGQTPPAEETPKPSPFEARLAELRKPAETPPADPPADPAAPPAEAPPADPAAPAVPEAGAPSGAPEAGAEASPGAKPAEAPGGAALVAKLPGARPGDPDLEIAIDDELKAMLEKKGINPQEFVDLSRQATNGLMRKKDYEAAREEIATDRAELEAVEDALKSDPAGWMVERIPDARRAETARELLLSLSDESWDGLMEEVATWDKDRGARATEATKKENERLKAKDQGRSRQDESAAVAETRKQIAEAIAGQIPDGMDDAEADEMFDYTVYKLNQHRVAKKLKHIDPAQIPQLMADFRVFERFNVTPASAGAAPPAKPAASPPPARPSGPTGKGKEPPPTREQVQKRVETRRAAAATAPAGAGAGVTGAAPPKGQTFKERAAWLRGLK